MGAAGPGMAGVLDVEADARRAFDVLKRGGIAILPNDVGYSLIGGSAAALKRIFETKGRAPTKLNAMLGNDAIHREVHVVDARQRDIVRAITTDHGLPLGLIAPARQDHPLLRSLERDAWEASSKAGTVCMLLNAGPFHEAICRLSFAETHPLFGSSANRTMTGTKFRVEDMEPEIRAIADVIIDYGLRKYHLYKASSTLLDIAAMKVVRFGSCYELIADILKRQFAIELPPKPA
ncbi:MAG: Sua5/YciO/YrdC/YwlC family protein [Alphaproteobacteria bacterium]|nr:Sua5/YciO/YrdC/YwlC family protein [Alphaproteobacteria bacterium]